LTVVHLGRRSGCAMNGNATGDHCLTAE